MKYPYKFQIGDLIYYEEDDVLAFIIDIKGYKYQMFILKGKQYASNWFHDQSYFGMNSVKIS